jgi:hypothetical protein
MKRYPSLLLTAALLLAAVAAPARASNVSWTYNWTVAPSTIGSDTPGQGFIQVLDASASPNVRHDTSDTVVANLFTHIDPSVPDDTKVTFNNSGPVKMSLLLQDNDATAKAKPNNSIIMDFTGHFSGYFTPKGANIRFTFDETSKPPVLLGLNTYTVNFDLASGAYAPPDPPGSSHAGTITAHVDVLAGEEGPPTNETPEPTTLALAGLGLSLGGLASWRRRVRGRKALAAA